MRQIHLPLILRISKKNETQYMKMGILDSTQTVKKYKIN